MTSRLGKAGLALALAGLLAACDPPVVNRGYVFDADAVAEIQPGVHGRREVAELLGTPSSVAAFDKNVWYYIGEQTQRVAFLSPDILDREVIVVRFNDIGVVEDVGLLGVEDGQEIQFVERTTPTAGNELTIWEQFFGNLGKFNKDQAAGGG